MNNASQKKYLIVDGHQDLAWNMLTFGRDYTRPVEDTRRREAGTEIPSYNGDTLLGWSAYQHGLVAVVFSTLFATPERWVKDPWDTIAYIDEQQAHRLYRQQVDAYHRLVDEHPDHFRLIQTRGDLEETLTPWQEEESRDPPVGLVILMEGADGVREPAELEEWWQIGVRLIGPAWAGTRYSGGTKEPGPLTKEGYALLEAMAQFGFVLDLSHMDEASALGALDTFSGRIVNSHGNALTLLKGSDSNRHLTDRVIRGLVERDAVMGVAFYNAFLKAGWKKGDPREEVSLIRVVDQIDYICQMAGDAHHAAIGTDFDGGLGWQHVPNEINTVADLQKLAPLLAERGFGEDDIAAIMGGNWIRVLKAALPESV